MDDADRAAEYQALFNQAALTWSPPHPDKEVCDECTHPTSQPIRTADRILCPECHGYLLE